MLTTLIIVALSITGSEQAEPAYVLQYPGLVFGWLPDELIPPVEGTLTDEAGVITSGPNATGTEYQLHYWKEDLESNTRKDEWLTTRFRNIISPDIFPSLVIGAPEWIEGSTSSEFWETRSIGLVPVLMFNRITDGGDIISKGMACAIFTEDHSILFYIITPTTATEDIGTEFKYMISQMYLAGE
ncbi:hypothetical protein DRQ25_09760 [Candidatus Fermentibacteria bacterium]|nr:MAG: hypothetical protein DRQ25_09760 [Candidatus Fermentibacteria bacterium]